MPPKSAIPFETPVVVRSPNWLGDAVMTLPAVRNLRNFLPPGAHLAVAAPEKLAALWDAAPFVDEIVELDRPRSIPAVAEMLKPGEYQTAILLPNSLRVAVEALAAGIRNTVAYPGHCRRWLLTHRVEPAAYDPDRQHQKYGYIDLMAALGAASDDSCPELVVPDSFEPLALPGTGPLLVLCPGAEYGPAKRWPAERFAAVAQTLQRERQARVVIAGAKADLDVAATVAELVGDAINLAGKTSLEQLMRLLAAARVVVSNDSGAMHLAAALGTPVAAIFGSTEHKLTGPVGPPGRTRVLRYHVPCSPCFLRDCPLDFACMERVEAEEVATAVRELWDGVDAANGTAIPTSHAESHPLSYRRGHFPYARRTKPLGPRRTVFRRHH